MAKYLKATEELSPGPRANNAFVPGLETLRFVFAAWVFLGHGGWPQLRELLSLDDKSLLGLFGVFISLPFAGTFAVVGFFIISGFCIHFPYARGEPFKSGKFLLARLLRIGLPLLAIIVITNVAGAKFRAALNGVLWSVYCEMAYYAVYPAIHWVFNKRREKTLFVASLVASLCLLPLVAKYKFLSEIPFYISWIYCAPIWLCGALLAGRWRRSEVRPQINGNIWMWRAAAVFFCAVSVLLVFHGRPVKVGYIWTAPLFTIFAVFWLEREMVGFGIQAPPKILERFGKASYTLYLVHMPTLIFSRSLTSFPAAVRYVVLLLALSVFVYAFYMLVERPAHLLARSISRRGRSYPVEPKVEPAQG